MMPLQAIEPLLLLAPVAGEIVWPAAAAVGTAMTAMGQAIRVLYQNGRGDAISAVSTFKDATVAIDKLATSNAELAASHRELTRAVRDHIKRTGSNG